MSSLDSPSPSGSGQTILAVDDDPDALKLCRLFLEKAGYSVLSATGSSEALRICKNNPGPIHLLVTDLIMPPRDFSFASVDNEFPHVHGHELARRALGMRKDLHVILVSADVDKDLQTYGIRPGSLPLLPKPLNEQTLLTLVNHTLQSPAPTLESLTKERPSTAKGADEWFD